MGLHYMNCPFCNLEADKVLLENAVGIALLDAFPVTEVSSSTQPILPLPRIRQVVAGSPIPARRIGAMGFPMPLGGSMPMPFVAKFAIHHPIRDAVDDGFVGRKYRGIQINQSKFTDGNFHSLVARIAINCSSVGNSLTRNRWG